MSPVASHLRTTAEEAMRIRFASRGGIFVGSIADYLCSLLPADAKPDSDGSVVYFAGAAEGPVKIGCTVDPAKRLQHLRCGSPVPLKILAAVPGGQALERAYHKAFALDRLHGEWFIRGESIRHEIRHWRAKRRRLSCVSD